MSFPEFSVSHEIVFGPDVDEDNRQVIASNELVHYLRKIAVMEQSPAFVRIQGLSIDGELQLANLSGRNVGLPNLVFANCSVPYIDLSCSQVNRLTFDGCEIGQVRAVNAEFAFGVEFLNSRCQLVRDVSPYLQFESARIKGPLRFQNFDLNAFDGGAVNLQNIDMYGEIEIVRSRIGGNLYLNHCACQKGIIFDLTTVTGVIYSNNFSCQGHFQFRNGCTIGVGEGGWLGDGLSIGGALLIWDAIFHGKINLIGGKIGINFEIKNSTINNINSQGMKIAYAIHFEKIIVIDKNNSISGCDVNIINFVNAKFCPDFEIKDLLSITSGAVFYFNNNKSNIVTINNSEFNGKINIKDNKFANLYISKLTGGRLLDTDARILTMELSGTNVSNTLSFSNMNAKLNNQFNIILHSSVIQILSIETDIKNSFGFNFEGKAISINVIHVLNYVDSNRYVRILKGNFFGSALRMWKGNSDVQFLLEGARAMRRSGWPDAAQKLFVAARGKQFFSAPGIGSKIWTLLFGLFFHYGYGKFRSVITLCLWIAIGTIGTMTAQERNMLIIDAQAVSSTVPQRQGAGLGQPTLSLTPSEATAGGSLPCGDAIEPVFYAIELILPVFDLGQKKQCTVRGREDSDPKEWFKREYVWWWIAKYIYTIFGWVIVSIFSLTMVGALRDNKE